MAELFNPTLPGVVFSTNATGWGRAGWLSWDDLTAEQQEAHEQAVAQKAAKDTDMSLDLGDPDTESAPAPGDTTKE
jgi:hypothetical protein